MVNSCCVDGCIINEAISKDVVLFKFPTSRVLRAKWLDAMKMSPKEAANASVCSNHFLATDYEHVRGRTRLKSNVVPTIFGDNSRCEQPKSDNPITGECKVAIEDLYRNKKHDKTQSEEDNKDKLRERQDGSDKESCKEDTEQNGVESQKKKEELREKSPDTDKITDKDATVGDLNEIKKQSKETLEEGKNDKEKGTDGTQKEVEDSLNADTREVKEEVPETIEICDIEKSISSHVVLNEYSADGNSRIEDVEKRKGYRICNQALDSVASSPAPSKPPDIDKHEDIEDLLTNYHIKQNNIHSLDNYETDHVLGAVDIKEDLPPLMTGSDPVFIEVAVDQDAAQGGDGRDCLMVLESVQVEVDPSELMLEQDFEVASVDLDDEPVPVEDTAISLLTSSDEDEVIIQEPHIDTVEVSDETDEDDMPLVKLVQDTRKAKKKRPKNPKNGEVLTWGLYEYFCEECQFRTTSQSDYNKHRLDHNRILLMCQLCGYMTSSEVQLAKHEKQHKDFKRHQCHLCDYKAKHNMSLVYHLKSHKTGKFKCKVCKFSAASESEQLRHVMVCRRNGRVKKKGFRCDKCSYRTDRSTDLRRHAKVHMPSDDDEEYVP